MTEVRFYHLVTRKLETALPELAAKALERYGRAIVKASSRERLESLDSVLWTYDAESFLPHSYIRDGDEALQPLWLTTEEDNPNGAKVLFLTDGASSEQVGAFDLCCEVFDGNDEAAVSIARARWKVYKEQGFEISYFQQNDAGKWEKKA